MSKASRAPSRFVGMHAHTGFSFFDGMGMPSEHIDYVVKNGMDAWCLTDHGHMNGFVHAFLHAEKMRKSGVNFKFVPGCEMYLHPDLGQWRQEYELQRAAKANDASAKRKVAAQKESIVTPLAAIVDSDDDPVAVEIDSETLTVEDESETKSGKFHDPVKRRHHLVVLPRTSEGLQRLFGLVSRGYKEGFYRFPRIDYAMLKEAAKGGHLLISSACLTGDAELITSQGLMTLLEVVETVKSGKEIYVLSCNLNSNKNEFKKVTWGDLTRKNSSLLEIKTKDGKTVKLTSDHQVYTDKGWLEAGQIKNMLENGEQVLIKKL